MRKILGLALALCFTVSACGLVGCGSGTSEEAKESGSVADTTSTASGSVTGSATESVSTSETAQQYVYPAWLGTSTGATTTASTTSPITIGAGKMETIATAPKYTVDPNDPTIVRLEETAISFQAVAKTAGEALNWDENSASNKWDTSYVYVDINMTGSRFEMYDTDLDGEDDSLPITHREFLRIARYGSVQDDQHPYLGTDGVNSNYQCSVWYDRSSIVCFSTTDSYFEGTETYNWMQKLIAGEKVYLKWQVTYHFVLDSDDETMLFDSVDYTIYFGNATADGVEWINAPSLYDPVNNFKMDGVLDPNGDIVNKDITGNTLTIDGGNCLNYGQYVSDMIINVSPNANFDVKVDYVKFN